jgi:hypothetical protein
MHARRASELYVEPAARPSVLGNNCERLLRVGKRLIVIAPKAVIHAVVLSICARHNLGFSYSFGYAFDYRRTTNA